MSRTPKPIFSNTGTGWIKLIALAFMLIDHAGKILCGNLMEMRILGRIAFPLYAWCLVVGFHYTRSIPKYLLRLLAVGLVSQPLYVWVLHHPWSEPNIILTLVLGLCALWGIEEKRWGSHFWAPALSLIGAVLLDANYGWQGVLLMILLYAAQENRSSLAAVMVAFCLFWGNNSSNISASFGGFFLPLCKWPGLSAIMPSFLKMQTWALLSLPFMLLPIPRTKDLRIPQWVGYLLYPGHLVLLYLLTLLQQVLATL